MSNSYTQRDFIVEKINQYLHEKGKTCVGPRRLHYWIVSLPEDKKQLPGQDGLRTYLNDKDHYDMVCEKLKEARYRGEVPWEAVIDEKNPPMHEKPDTEAVRLAMHLYRSAEAQSLGELKVTIKPTCEWDAIVDRYVPRCDVKPSRFQNRTHWPVIAIEKPNAEAELRHLRYKYGADLLLFKGGYSNTRLYDVAKRAKEAGLPIVLLYFADLDPAGWDMPIGAMDRIQKFMYPHEDHKVIRIGLLREHAETYHLPDAFRIKNYPKKQKQRFIRQSGGNMCIEIEALDERVIVSMFETELKKWACLEDDQAEYERAKGITEDVMKDLKERKEELLEDFKEEYEYNAQKYNELAEELKGELDEIVAKYKERMVTVEDNQSEIMEGIRTRFWEELAEVEKDIFEQLKEDETENE